MLLTRYSQYLFAEVNKEEIVGFIKLQNSEAKGQSQIRLKYSFWFGVSLDTVDGQTQLCVARGV